MIQEMLEIKERVRRRVRRNNFLNVPRNLRNLITHMLNRSERLTNISLYQQTSSCFRFELVDSHFYALVPAYTVFVS